MKMRLSIPIWLILPVVLTVETALCAVLAAATLETLVRRPEQGGGSITTLFPGFVYASATVMKVCLVSAVVSAVAGLAWRLARRGVFTQANQPVPVLGIASIALTPSTPFIGALAVVGFQSMVPASDMMSSGHFSAIARKAVFVMLAIIVAAMGTAVVSLIRREHHRAAPILSLALNAVLIELFCHLRFYALGFDQDTWAPR